MKGVKSTEFYVLVMWQRYKGWSLLWLSKKLNLLINELLRATSDTTLEYYGQEFGRSRKEGNKTNQSMRSVKKTSAVTKDGDCLYSASQAA